MTENTRLSLGSVINNLDDNRSPLYITVALLFYFIPVILISILFVSSARTVEFENTFIGLAWVVIVILPLMLTFGVFIVYRATYSARTYLETEEEAVTASEEELQWDYVINKALDWHRFLMPLCLLNMFITLIGGFLLYADIDTSGSLNFGSYSIGMEFTTSITEVQVQELATQELETDEDLALFEQDLNAANERILFVPSSIFYLGLLGFFVQFLEMTRRRYVSRNIVPRFYLMSAFRLLQVVIATFVMYLFLNIIVEDPPRDLILLASFFVGMFPVQALNPIIESIQQRLGTSAPKEVPVTLINGVDHTLESLLQEENIDSVQILASTDISELHKRTAIPKRTLVNWQRQARLFNVLGTEALIHRFARIGINDFDDIGMLVRTMGALPTNSQSFQNDFTRAMLIKSDDDAMNTDAYWKVLVQVLIREYYAEYPEAEVTIVPAVIPNPVVDTPPIDTTVPASEPMFDVPPEPPAPIAESPATDISEPMFDMPPADVPEPDTDNAVG